MKQMMRLTEVAPAKNSLALMQKPCPQMILTWWKALEVASGWAHKPGQGQPPNTVIPLRTSKVIRRTLYSIFFC